MLLWRGSRAGRKQHSSMRRYGERPCLNGCFCRDWRPAVDASCRASLAPAPHKAMPQFFAGIHHRPRRSGFQGHPKPFSILSPGRPSSSITSRSSRRVLFSSSNALSFRAAR